MRRLGGVTVWRHAVVGGSIAVLVLAALGGLIGDHRPMQFSAQRVVVSPGPGDGLAVEEIVDIDFGTDRRHGYERVIPNDLGAVTDVTASSPTAPDQLDVADRYVNTRIRIGDPDRTISGQHRYALSYVYPETPLDEDLIALDLIDHRDDFETERFELIVTGFELDRIECHLGGFGDRGGCDLVDDGDVYRLVIEPLHAGRGLTLFARVVGERPVVDHEPPPVPEPRPSRRGVAALIVVLVGVAVAGGLYVFCRVRGRNEVFAGGAADAAFGVSTAEPLQFPPPGGGGSADGPPGVTDLPPPPPGIHPSAEPGAPGPSGGTGAAAFDGASTRMMSDAKLAELATIEFVPPQGVDPWLGNVVLAERHNSDAVAAWISGHAAHDVLEVTKADTSVMLAKGPKYDTASQQDRAILDRLLGTTGSIKLGKYSKEFAAAWTNIGRRQRELIASSGLWRRPIPGQGLQGTATNAGGIGFLLAAVVVVFFLMSAARTADAAIGLPFRSLLGAVTLAIVVPGLLAAGLYRRLLPSRTAIGSAMALRTESFRRFLAASEGKHVEWAWKHGLLREYSAWAVALDVAEAWEGALHQSAVPPAEYRNTPSLLLFHNRSSVRSTHVQPPSSGGGSGSSFGGGGGGFSSSVGGGGGGGSRGSW